MFQVKIIPFFYSIIIFSWRANESDENENERPTTSSGPSYDDRRNDNRRTGGFGDDRRGQNRDNASGNRD